ncbi:MAG TPA: hypothetical protein VKP13_09720 [Nitrospira sp.]|nr:hypothetical protein [Nitrospira sp.]
MQSSIDSNHPHTQQQLTRWTLVGLTGFTFFLVKGVLWLLAPLLFALMR